MIRFKDNLQKGFTLLEMLVSISVITIGVIGIFSVVIKYTQFTQQARTNLTASYLAQEGIEIVKNIRDSNWTSGANWNTGLASCASGCEADYLSTSLSAWADRYLYVENSTGFYKYLASPGSSDVQTPYKRKITITAVGNDELDIKVDIYWSGNTTTVKENIYNWKP